MQRHIFLNVGLETDQLILKKEYNYREVGAFQDGERTQFVVWAPEKKSVDVIINNEKHPLTKDEFGYWQTVVSDLLAGAQYKFSIDGGDPLPDPASMCQPDGVHGVSEVADRSFAWSDSYWKGLPLSEMILYELHAGTFTSEGTFEGVITKLDHLKALGVNAIELMPLAQFPGERNWGYDGVYPFAAQHSYGGYKGLKKLVDAAHKQGIAVILDVVYNHQGPEGNYFEAYAPYFTEKYNTFWGKALNFDDAHCDGVRNFYWQNALMWLDEFHIDGLRLDAVHAIWDYSAKPFIDELSGRVKDLAITTGKKKVLIAEFDLNNPRYINEKSKGGYGLDGQWTDEYHHALHSLLTGETDGYYEDFGKDEHLIRSLEDSYVYTGQYSIHRKKFFGVKPDNAYSQFVVFAQNHDQIGNRLLGERLTSQLSFEGLKLAAASYLLSPHVPMLFMGEEYGETNPFQYFISHTDEKLVQMVREGRKKEFSYFNWKGEIPDPQNEKTFRDCVLSWKFSDDEERNTLFRFYQYLIRFRKERKAYHSFERASLKVYPSGSENVVVFERQHGGDRVLIAFNFNKKENSFSQPLDKPVRLVLDSSSFTGNKTKSVEPVEPKSSINIKGESAMIFEL